MRRYVSAILGIVLTGVVVAIIWTSRGPDLDQHPPAATLAATSPIANQPPAPMAASTPAPSQPQSAALHFDRAAPARDLSTAPAALPRPAERPAAVQQLVGQSQEENEQLGQIDEELAAALQRAADEAWRRQAVAARAAAQHAATLEALETLRRSQALLATGDSDGVDEELARAEVSLSGRTRLDVEAAREALARSDLYPARQYLEAALLERRMPR
jgi:soluble lytic murein transglycosylase-like protein